MSGKLGEPSPEVWRRLERFHLDSIACAVSAIAMRTSAPTVLRDEALEYAAGGRGATCFGSTAQVQPEKAVAANSSAVREWDANGTNFGYNPARQATAGEFGHNDFYPVAIAAAQVGGLDGAVALRGMLLIDEIRGRLAEVFSLKTHKIDHVVHGAIASAVVYAAMLGATPMQIESAIGLLVAHYIPFRAIRAGHQLSDSKGASAAISAEAAVLAARRAMGGFAGPADIFRNPQAIFCLFESADRDCSPFDLTLTTAGDDFAVMGMHFKLGLYEHQSAGAIQALLDVLATNSKITKAADQIQKIRITIYEPAYSIICDPAKRDPQTRQSADHSLFYIVATILRKARESGAADWKSLMLMPADYDGASLKNSETRRLMQLIDVKHGGAEFDKRYPDGIPTRVEIELASGSTLTSGLIMYPAGHARNTTADLEDLLDYKFRKLAALGVRDADAIRNRFAGLAEKSANDIAAINNFEIL